jgi:hypothetical protein
MIRNLLAICALLLLTACGGGGGSASSSSSSISSSPNPSGPPPALTNFATLTVDAGPPALDTGPNAYIQYNVAYVSIILCAPGSTTNCQTIDHVQVDTGSVGLRIPASVLNASLLSALPIESDSNSKPLGECYGYVDGYAFGSVRQADFQVGGEKVAAMPLQVIGDSGAFAHVPSLCSAGGGANLATVSALGANGIIGVGVTTTDCGTVCATSGGYSAAIYYDCPASGCGSIVAEAASTAAPFQQVPNPVAAMAVDNNGTMVVLPSAPAAGETSMTGTIYFGIGTQTNNALGTASVLLTSTSASPEGAGLITAVYNGQALNESTIDSGTNLYFFVDRAITGCTGQYVGYYCPTSPLALNATLQGTNGASTSVSFTLQNAATLLNTTDAVLPDIGGNPNTFSGLNAYPQSFDFGLPFFYGRRVYTAIEGRNASGTTGPYFAF